MPAWLIAILTPILNRIISKIGDLIISNIKKSIKESKRINDYEKLNDAKSKAAYVKSMLS